MVEECNQYTEMNRFSEDKSFFFFNMILPSVNPNSKFVVLKLKKSIMSLEHNTCYMVFAFIAYTLRDVDAQFN